MPKFSPTATPKYRKHKASGQAVVTLSGRDFYLGPYDSLESRSKYDRLITEWIANGRGLIPPADDLAVVELIAAYVREVKRDYGDSTEWQAIVYALRPLKEL